MRAGTDDDGRFAAAQSVHRSGRLTEAAALYRTLLEVEPNHPGALHYAGLLADQRGNSDEAIELLTRSLAVAPERAEYHNNFAIVLAHAGRHEEALELLDEAIRLRPGYAEAHHNRGMALEKLGRREEALAAWERAIELKPDYFDAHLKLGEAVVKGFLEQVPVRRRETIQTLDRATVHLRRAVELSPKHPSAHFQLGNALRESGDVQGAIGEFRRAIELRPNFVEAHGNLGAAFNDLAEHREAIVHLERAIELRPDFVDGHWNLSLALLALGDWPRGWLEYEWRRQLPAERTKPRRFRQPEWNGCGIRGRRVLVLWEQGLGDTVQFIRYAKRLADEGAEVIVECQPSLAELLRTCPGVARVVPRGEMLPAFDTHVRLASLPGMFRTTIDYMPADVPYLFANAERVKLWVERLEKMEQIGRPWVAWAGDSLPVSACSGFSGAGASGPHPDPLPEYRAREKGRDRARPLRIGIAWQGNPNFSHDDTRSIPLIEFSPLAQIEGLRLISLQKNAGREQIEKVREVLPIETLDPEPDADGGVADTPAIMANLDLVVTSDSFVAHLAGALGVRTWVALSHSCDWRWLRERDDCPWYPAMRLFRQRAPGDWADVFRRIAEATRSISREGANMRHTGETALRQSETQ